MNERPHSIRPADEHISDEISERVRSVLSAAESAAGAIRHEAEEEAQIHRRAVEAECARYIEDARRQAEELLIERVKRISEVSDALLEGADSLMMRIDEANGMKQAFVKMVEALGVAAEELVGQRTGLDAGQAEAVESPDARSGAERGSLRSQENAALDGQDGLAAGPAHLAEGGAQAEDPTAGAGATESGAAQNDREEQTPLQVIASGAADAGDEMLGARLVALQMAVAGGNRGEVKAHLIRAFELPDPAEILDDVFGAGTDGATRVAWPKTSDAGI